MRRTARFARIAGVAVTAAASAAAAAAAWGVVDAAAASATKAAASASTGASCRKAYESLFARDAIEVAVLFGYKDARPARYVGDRYERAHFVQWLVTPCRDGDLACGFRRDDGDAELFRRSVPGPDGKPREIRLRVIDSSAGPDDQENRADPYQAWKTRHAREEFRAELRRAHVVFYNGHSRDGGGPDFEPPRLTADGHVDYLSYARQQAGLKEMVAELKKAGKGEGPRLIGMFSCSSTQHFAGEIREARPGVGVLASRRLMYFADALESSRLALSAILAMKCQPDFNRTIEVRSNQAGTTLLGFFE